MKTIRIQNLVLAAGLFLLAGALNLQAQNIIKSDTTTMNTAADWSGNTPASPAIGEFDSTVSAVNLAAMALGGNVGLGGLQLDGNMNGPLTIATGSTLTTGTSGINMSAANQNLTINCALTVTGSAQTWNVAPGLTLAVNTIGAAQQVTTITNSGTVTLAGAYIDNNSADGGGLVLADVNFVGHAVSFSRTAAFNTAPTPAAPINASGANGFIVKNAPTVASVTTISIGGLSSANSSASMLVSGGSLTASGRVQIGGITGGSTRWDICQVSGGSFTATDTANGIVLSPNNTAATCNAEFYINGTGTATVGKISYGAGTDTVGGIGWVIVKGGSLYVGSGGVVRATPIAGYTANFSLFSGLMGAAADWSSSLNMVLSGTNGPAFTIQAADASSVAHNITLSGIVSGTNALVKTGGGVLALSGANTYSNVTTINAGVLRAGSAESVNVSGPLGRQLASAVGTILFGGGTLQYSAANQNDYSGRFDNGTLGSQPISIDTAGQTVTFATALAGAGTSLTKLGNGRLNLTAPNTYDNGTTNNGGTLTVNNATGSGTGTGAVLVNSGGLIGGNGAISGAVTINSGAGLSPGNNGVGTNTLGSLALNAGATNNFEFNASPANDQTIVTASGGLVVNGGVFNLYAEGGTIGWTTPGTYKLVQYSGAISGTGTDGSGNLNSDWTTASGSNPHVANPQFGLTYQFGTSGGYVTLTIISSLNTGSWGVNGDGNWSLAGNWTAIAGTMPPRTAGDGATFGTGTALRTVTLDVNETVGGITMNNNNSFVIANAGNTLTLDNGGAGVTINVSGGTANVIQTAVALNDNTAATVSGGKSLAISGVVSNSPSVIKTLTVNGAGTTVLSAANAYGPAASGTTGTTLTGGGTLQVGNSSSLGAGDLNVSGSSTLQSGAAGLNIANNLAVGGGAVATVDNNGNDLTLGGIISGAGSLVKNSAGVLTLGGANTYAGSTTINGGIVGISTGGASAGSPSSLGAVPASATPNSIVLNGGDLLATASLALNANRGIGIGATAGSTSATALIDAAGGQILTVNGIIASAGNTGTNSLTVNSGAGNNGTVILGGANTFNGQTVISNGTVQLANSLALQNSILNYNNQGGTLNFGALTAATLGGLTGAQNLTLNTNASLVGVALTLGGSASTTYSGSLSGNGALIRGGSGRLTLTGSNTYTNTTTVNSGSLEITNNGSINGGGLIGQGFLVDGGSVTSVGPSRLNSAGNAFAESSGTVSVGDLSQNDNSDGFFASITGGSFSASSFSMLRTSSFATAPTATGPLAAATTAGLYINGTTANVNLGALSVCVLPANSSGTARMDAGTLTVTNEVQVGNMANTRWTIFQIGGGSFTNLDAVNGIVISPNAIGGAPLATNANNGEAYFSGGTSTVEKIAFGAASDPVGGTGWLFINGNNTAVYLGGGGIVQPNTAGYTANISFLGGLLGAKSDWSSSLPMQLSGTSFTLRAADAAGVAHNITLGGGISGSGNLLKTGPGTLNLSGASSYGGTTTVSNGTLLLVSGGTTGSGAATVLTNGILGGAGTVSSDLTVNNGGRTLSGGNLGNTAGLLTTVSGNLVYNAGAEADFNLSNTHLSGNDQMSVSGSLNANGVNVGINLTDLANTNLDTTADYVLFNVSGGMGSSFATVPKWLGLTPTNAVFFSVQPVGSQVVLHYSPIIISSASVAPNPAPRSQLVTISVDTTNPAPGVAITGVAVDASAIGGSPTLSLVQSNGTSVYTNSVVVSPATPVGIKALTVTVNDSASNIRTLPVSLTVIGALEVWDGLAGNNTWGAGANWVSGVSPIPDDLVTFAGTTQLTPNLQAGYSISSLTFSNNAGSFNITNDGSGTLILTGGVTNNSTSAQTLSVPVALSGVPAFNTAAGNITVNNIISDGVGGSGLVKSGANTLTLAGNNTYTGPTTVNNGVLVLSGNNGAASGPVTNNATLQLANLSAVPSNPLVLNSGSTLQLRADSDNVFTANGLAVQNTSNTLGFDVGPLTSGTGNLALSGGGALAFANSSSQTINVTGNSTYLLTLGDINTVTTSHTPYLSFNLNTLPAGPGLVFSSFTTGNFGNYLNFKGGGKVTVQGNLGNTSNGSINLFVNDGTTLTLLGSSVKSGNGDAYRYAVQSGTLVLDSGTALINNSTAAGLNQSYFILGAATNIYTGTGFSPAAGVLISTNNSFNAAVYLGDVNNPVGGFTTAATLTNNISDGDVGFTNNGVFTVGGQNTGGVNTYANPIILGLTANRGKSVTLVAATDGEVDFTGNILRNGTDTTAGVTAGDATHHGLVKLLGANTYGGSTIVNAGTLEIAQATLATNSLVAVVSGAVLQLDFAVTNTVAVLNLNGVSKAPGVYSASTDPTYLAGSGKLQVVVSVPSAPVAGFSGTPTGIFAGQSVVFANTSTGNYTSSAWTFGDGNVANPGNAAGNVTNTYASTAGSPYTVQLIVTGPGGASTNTQTGYVTVKPKAVIGNPVLSGGNLILSGVNGPAGQAYRILSSTNVALPLGSWTPVYTNVFAPDGSYSYTNTPVTNKASFFILVSP